MDNKPSWDEILKVLYETHRESPSNTIERDELISQIGASAEKIRSGLAYLEKKGYIEITRRPIGSRIFNFIQIAAEGIDLVEGRVTDEIVRVGGDLVQITIGDNVRNVAAGKQIVQNLTDNSIIIQLDKLLGEFVGRFEASSELPTRTTHELTLQAKRLRESLRQVGLLDYKT